MTEQEWLACTDPSQLLKFLDREGVFALSASQDAMRRLRLFACACLQPIRRHGCEIFKAAIETAERFAEGMGSPEELETARQAAASLADPEGEQWYADRAWVQPEPVHLALALVAHPEPRHAVTVLVNEGVKPLHLAWESERVEPATFPKFMCQLFRCIFHNPFHHAVVDPSWFTWNDCTIPKLAQAIYDERRFQELPILADALEEAGCRNTDLLGHLRAPGPHVRGCWVLDFVLGKTECPSMLYNRKRSTRLRPQGG